MNMSGHHSASYADSGFGGSSRSSSWKERRHKRNENRRHDWDEERSGLGGDLLKHTILYPTFPSKSIMIGGIKN